LLLLLLWWRRRWLHLAAALHRAPLLCLSLSLSRCCGGFCAYRFFFFFFFFSFAAATEIKEKSAASAAV
jgi:hypothetical protein